MAFALAHGVVHMNCILYFMLVFSVRARIIILLVRSLCAHWTLNTKRKCANLCMECDCFDGRSSHNEWMDERWPSVTKKAWKGARPKYDVWSCADARVKKNKMENKRWVNFADCLPVFSRPRVESFSWNGCDCVHQMYFISENLVH